MYFSLIICMFNKGILEIQNNFCGNTECLLVAHFILLKNEANVQECDARMLNRCT